MNKHLPKWARVLDALLTPTASIVDINMAGPAVDARMEYATAHPGVKRLLDFFGWTRALEAIEFLTTYYNMVVVVALPDSTREGYARIVDDTTIEVPPGFFEGIRGKIRQLYIRRRN